MSDNIILRPAETSDIPQLVDLMNSQYSRKKDKFYFLWQYFNSFYPTVLICAFVESTLVGMFGLQKRELKNGVWVGQATDLLVSSGWRRHGIFRSLGTKAASYFGDLVLMCVLPNLHGKNACEKAFGWRTIGKIDSVVLHRDSLRNSTKEFHSAYDTDRKRKDLVMFKYEEETRNWRFDQHPDYQYTYIRLSTGEFAVVKIFIDPVTGARYGDIVDFECDLNDRNLLRELFAKASTYLKEQNVESITSWALPDTALREVVESLGFTDMPQERYFCVKVLKNEFEYLYDLSNWHLVQADSEIY